MWVSFKSNLTGWKSRYEYSHLFCFVWLLYFHSRFLTEHFKNLMEKKQECEHIFIKEKAKLHFISGRELLYKKEKTQTDEQLKSHLIFTAFNNFTFGCFCSPLVSTHHVNRSPYRHKRKHDQHLTHTNTSRKEEKCLLSAVRLSPLLAISCAAAFPIPLLAPVTMKDLPFRFTSRSAGTKCFAAAS